jgi:hypothetical protein
LHAAPNGQSFPTVPGERLSLKIELGADDDAGADEQDELTRALREELLELDVESVERPAGAAPEGTRGVDAVGLGTLVITAVVAVAGVAVARWRGGGAWPALVAVAGGTALFAAVSIRDYTGVQGDDSNSGLVLALVGGLVVAAAGVYALLRPAPPPGPP